MPPQPTSPAREAVRAIVPKLAEISDKVIYADVWERPGLSRRDRSLITVATLVALGREKQLEGHLQRALGAGPRSVPHQELDHHRRRKLGRPAEAAARRVVLTREPE